MTLTQVLSSLTPEYSDTVSTVEDYDDGHDHDDDEVGESTRETLRHPLGVRPGGNALTTSKSLQFSMGAFRSLPDATILVLLEYLDPMSLVRLGSTCRAFFAFTSHDQLWRDIGVNGSVANVDWRGSWRASIRKLPYSTLPNVDCQFLFSDALHRPFLCSQINFKSYASNIPVSNQISRLRDLSGPEFEASWANRPFILTEPVKKWPVFDKWSEAALRECYADTSFRAEAVDWPLKTYIRYMNDNCDESPLYLFDRSFVEKMGLVIGINGDYEPPECFRDDLFTVLGEQRPDHRWLIIGPERSGSTFHKDPNATSAWNAVIRGSKYWIMFPNSNIPPGVFMSEDQSEVTSPLSIAEWMLTFHEEARNTPGCVEGICGEGEVLHVPSGWWHLVVNLESAIAITQNFVPRPHLPAAVNFLKYKANQVSGFREEVTNPLALFTERLERDFPELMVELEASTVKKRKWEEVVGEKDNERSGTGGFSFGFGDDLDEEVT